MPSEILAGALAPVARMQALMTFARSLLSDADGFRLVWVLVPLEIENSAAYGAFAAALLEYRLTDPWCARMRILLLFPGGASGRPAAVGVSRAWRWAGVVRDVLPGPSIGT